MRCQRVLTKKRLVAVFGPNGHQRDLVTDNIRAAEGEEFIASCRSGVAFL